MSLLLLSIGTGQAHALDLYKGTHTAPPAELEAIYLEDIRISCINELRVALPRGEADQRLQMNGYNTGIRGSSSNIPDEAVVQITDADIAEYETFQRDEIAKDPSYASMAAAQKCALKRRLCQVGRAKYCMGRPYFPGGVSRPLPPQVAAAPAPVVFQRASVPPGVNPKNPWYKPENATAWRSTASWINDISLPAGEDLRKACGGLMEAAVNFRREAGFTDAVARLDVEQELRDAAFSKKPSNMDNYYKHPYPPGSDAAKYDACIVATRTAQLAGKRGIPLTKKDYDAWEAAQANNPALAGVPITPLAGKMHDRALFNAYWTNGHLPEDMLHNVRDDMTQCIQVVPTGTRIEWGTSGKYKMINTCSEPVEASWCENRNACAQRHGGMWTIEPGKDWPIFFTEADDLYIRIGGCKVKGNRIPIPSDAALSRQGGINTRHNDPPAAPGVERDPYHKCQ